MLCTDRQTHTDTPITIPAVARVGPTVLDISV